MCDPHNRLGAHPVAVLLLPTLLMMGIAGLAILPGAAHVGGGGGVSVTIVEANTPVAEGETLNVTAEVENTADDSHTIRAVFYVAGAVRDSQTANLAAGESATVTLSWETQPGDAGDYEAAVEVGDDYDTTDISIRRPANLSIEMEETNSPLVEGEALAVTATVENTGGITGTETVSLVVGDEVRDRTSVSVDGNTNRSVTLTWRTEDGDAGTYDISARLGNTTVTATVAVEAASENDSVNQAPTSGITADFDAETVDAGTTVSFEAAASDPDGEVVSYEWRVDGEVVSTDRTVSYTFEEPGSHEVRLIVTDDDGSVTAVTRTVQVAALETTAGSTSNPPTSTSGASGHGFGVVLGLGAVGLLVGLRHVW